MNQWTIHLLPSRRRDGPDRLHQALRLLLTHLLEPSTEEEDQSGRATREFLAGRPLQPRGRHRLEGL
jgi:hypothetical protein